MDYDLRAVSRRPSPAPPPSTSPVGLWTAAAVVAVLGASRPRIG
jgi:hypothetical protein